MILFARKVFARADAKTIAAVEAQVLHCTPVYEEWLVFYCIAVVSYFIDAQRGSLRWDRRRHD